MLQCRLRSSPAVIHAIRRCDMLALTRDREILDLWLIERNSNDLMKIIVLT